MTASWLMTRAHDADGVVIGGHWAIGSPESGDASAC